MINTEIIVLKLPFDIEFQNTCTYLNSHEVFKMEEKNLQSNLRDRFVLTFDPTWKFLDFPIKTLNVHFMFILLNKQCL